MWKISDIVKKLISDGHNVTCADIKPLDYWFQTHEDSKNISLDLRNLNNCESVVDGNEFVINMAWIWVELVLLNGIKLTVWFQF